MLVILLLGFLPFFSPANEKDYSKILRSAKKYDVQVVSSDFLEGIKTSGLVANINKFSIADWGCDVSVFISNATLVYSAEKHNLNKHLCKKKSWTEKCLLKHAIAAWLTETVLLYKIVLLLAFRHCSFF